jgi:metallo-beta-lactamase family protein
MANHLANNLDSAFEIQLTGMMHPVSVNSDHSEEEILGDQPAKRVLDERGTDIEIGDSAQFGSDAIHGTISELSDQIEAIELALRSLSGQVAIERHDTGLSEEDVRRIVRDEMDEIVREAVERNQSG